MRKGLADQLLGQLHIADLLAQVHMQHRAARILALEFILQIQRFEDIIRKAHGQLGGVGVIRLVLAGRDDAGVALLIQLGQAIAGTLGRGGLEVVYVAGLLLEAGDVLAHEIQRTQG